MTYVAPSGIHGLGLFARQAIVSGQVIGYVEGEETRDAGDHVLWVAEDQGIRVSCCLRYINHASPPNACYYDDGSVVALRDIPAGEEITHDYAACAL